MKKIFVYICLLSFCLVSFLGCKKEQSLEASDLAAPVRLEIKGLILVDTLQFLLEGKLIGQGIGGAIRISDRLYQPGQKIQVRRKADGKQIDEILIAEKPFNQVKKIFYDGITFTDKIDLTPVSNQNNMGVRMRFSSSSDLFYGGPVDVELMVEEIDFNTFEFTYVKSNLIFKNITAAFGEFVELPSLVSTDVMLRRYVVIVHKAGTNEPPYKNGIQLGGDPNPDFVFGYLDNFMAGESALLSVTDSFSGRILSGYQIEDLSTPFK